MMGPVFAVTFAFMPIVLAAPSWGNNQYGNNQGYRAGNWNAKPAGDLSWATRNAIQETIQKQMEEAAHTIANHQSKSYGSSDKDKKDKKDKKDRKRRSKSESSDSDSESNSDSGRSSRSESSGRKKHKKHKSKKDKKRSKKESKKEKKSKKGKHGDDEEDADKKALRAELELARTQAKLATNMLASFQKCDGNNGSNNVVAAERPAIPDMARSLSPVEQALICEVCTYYEDGESQPLLDAKKVASWGNVTTQLETLSRAKIVKILEPRGLPTPAHKGKCLEVFLGFLASKLSQ